MKLLRLLFVILIGLILFCVIYSIPALIAMIFGGSFTAITQNEMYVIWFTIISLICVGVILNDTFDSDFYAKR